MPPVRTRFAPSPTGYLHIGGARTALYNWAFARHQQGRFVLRVEDTDRQRSTPEAEAAVLDGLRWLGIDWDEGPLRQSERSVRYAEVVERLLEKGRAYRCVCTREELEARKQATIAAGRKWTYDGRCRDRGYGADVGLHTVRLRLPETGRLMWDDLVFGPSGQDAEQIGDMILRRSDGGPLYHLAVVVDDVDMGITHVIRGADHLSNTPFQLALYAALDAAPPRFAHVPLIVGEDGKKLSKRRAPVAVQQYRDAGHPADAVRNWLVRIGWSHGDQEIFSREEIAELFTLEAVHRSPGRADPSKLAWLSQHYVKSLPQEQLFAELAPFLEAEAGHAVAVTPALARGVELLRERSRTLVEMAALARFLVVPDDALRFDEKAVRKHWTAAIRPALSDLRAKLAEIPVWEEKPIQTAFEAVLEAHALALGKLAQPVRIAVTGGPVSPGIFETLAVLGRERTLNRLDGALARIPEPV